MIRTGYTPSVLWEMEVVFLSKVRKGNYTEPKAYRPITLSSFLLNGLVRIVQWCLLERVIC